METVVISLVKTNTTWLVTSVGHLSWVRFDHGLGLIFSEYHTYPGIVHPATQLQQITDLIGPVRGQQSLSTGWLSGTLIPHSKIW